MERLLRAALVVAAADNLFRIYALYIRKQAQRTQQEPDSLERDGCCRRSRRSRPRIVHRPMGVAEFQAQSHDLLYANYAPTPNALQPLHNLLCASAPPPLRRPLSANFASYTSFAHAPTTSAY
jgi:hypothetical protein